MQSDMSDAAPPGGQAVERPGPGQPVLKSEWVTRTFVTGAEELRVLRGADMEVRRGEMVAIVGPSGSGKSTLLHILGGLDRPTSGRVFLDSLDLFGYPEAQLPGLRNRKLGFVFQFHHLLAEFNVVENVALPLLIAGVDRQSAAQRATDVLGEVGFTTRHSHRPGELSGGERAKVAMARALANDPVVVLADEPTGNLDAESADGLAGLMARLCRERGRTMLVVTHNPAVAGRADRRLRLQDGKLSGEAGLA
jgi:lipoprotein-releasing system ATP-binding protein